MTTALMESPPANGSNRLPTSVLASQLGIDRGALIDTLRGTIMPSNASNEDLAAFCIVSSKYGLNPFTKEIYAYPKKGGGIQPVVGIDGWVTLVNRQPSLDGVEFEEDVENGKPVKTTCVMYLKGRTRPVRVTEWFEECKRNSEPWNQMPRRMLRHKAYIQCARVAFGLAGIVDDDEGRDVAEGYEGRVTVTTARPKLAERLAAPRQLPAPVTDAEGDQRPEEEIAEAAAKVEPQPVPAAEPSPAPTYSQLRERITDYAPANLPDPDAGIPILDRFIREEFGKGQAKAATASIFNAVPAEERVKFVGGLKERKWA